MRIVSILRMLTRLCRRLKTTLDLDINMPLTQDELQTVIDLVDARLDRQYNEEYQNILDKLTEFQWRTYELHD